MAGSSPAMTNVDPVQVETALAPLEIVLLKPALPLRDALGLLQRAGLGLAGAADRLDRAARLAGFFRDLGVLLGDDRLGRLVAVEAAERGGRNPAVRPLRAVLVIDVGQHEFADGAGAWFASHVVVPSWKPRAPTWRRVCPKSGGNTTFYSAATALTSIRNSSRTRRSIINSVLGG